MILRGGLYAVSTRLIVGFVTLQRKQQAFSQSHSFEFVPAAQNLMAHAASFFSSLADVARRRDVAIATQMALLTLPHSVTSIGREFGLAKPADASVSCAPVSLWLILTTHNDLLPSF